MIAERETAEYFEAVAKDRDPKVAANWVTGELFGALNRSDRKLSDCKVSADSLGKLVDLIADGTLSNRLAKEVFEFMFESGDDPETIVQDKGLKQVTDTGAIEAAVDNAIRAGAAQVEQYRDGNEKVIGWFVGQVMRATGGKANPQTVNAILRRKLDG